MTKTKHTFVDRRDFLRKSFVGMASVPLLSLRTSEKNHFSKSRPLIKPPRLQNGDTIALVTPASGPFESSTIWKTRVRLQNLGFRVKLGKHISENYGYLAGSDRDRAEDLHTMFKDSSVRAIVALRGGYGSGRLLNHLDFELIRNHPKILIGYSDITSLLLMVYKLSGLVVFHGPVGVSDFTDYTQKYFRMMLSSTKAAGPIDFPEPEDPLLPANQTWPIHGGRAAGRVVGGNLTLVCASLGTPYEIETKGKLLFLEDTEEEPYSLDRMFTQLDNAGKLDEAAAIVLGHCEKCGPRDFKPGFDRTLSVEEVYRDRLGHLKKPILADLPIGHLHDKITVPLGIRAAVDADKRQFIFEEAAVS
ncbi:putative murein peptide carboxypeptidase [bacterium BMS3Bbin03]|nr:putative murein peptide carboxypeptidase [bacterium BMS3Bbin03]